MSLNLNDVCSYSKYCLVIYWNIIAAKFIIILFTLDHVCSRLFFVPVKQRIASLKDTYPKNLRLCVKSPCGRGEGASRVGGRD